MAYYSNYGGGQRFETNGEVTSTTAGTPVTAGSPAHIEGTKTQIAAADTAFESDGVIFHINSNGGGRFLLRPYVGAVGVEQPLLRDTAGNAMGILVLPPRPATTGQSVFLPLSIPASTRVTVSAQSTIGTAAYQVSLTYLKTGFMPWPTMSGGRAYGITSATTSGTSIDPTIAGVYAEHTKGDWFSLGTTVGDHRSIILSAQLGEASREDDSRWLLDLGIGTGNDTIIPNLLLGTEFNSDQVGASFFGPFPMFIPSGTAVRARCQHSQFVPTPALATRELLVAVYGF